MTPKIAFRQFLASAFEQGTYTTDDVIAFVLPLFKEVLSFHEEGRVAPFEQEDALFLTEGRLDIDENKAHQPAHASAALQALFPNKSSSGRFEIVGSLKLDTDVDEGSSSLEDLQLQFHPSATISRPVYLPGYGCYELVLGHHDDQTDIFCLGLVLAGMALGLDLYDEDDLKLFVSYRTKPVGYNSKIHPTLSTLITEMTELDRSKRNQDLYEVIQRLENYRDFDPEKQTDLSQVVGWKSKESSDKSSLILNKLRNRLFDTSRRNRLLYYKPNLRFVNLTVSSVPVVLHYQSIRPELLFTWNTEIAGKVKDMKEIVLNKYLRFEDHPYLTASLDKIRVEARHDLNEFGFSQLKLVIAFLNWHNLKEDKNERIQSPLLLIPVELKKNKKVHEDHYLMKVLANEAEVNPIVANSLRELYGIRLPDFIDLDETTLEAFFQKLKEQIDSANQGIALNYIDKPRIKLVHSVARQTVSNYRKRLRKSGGLDSYKNIAYSYQPEHFKPLGLEIFRQRIEPRPSFLQFLVNDDIQPPIGQLTDARERQLFQMVESESNPYSWDLDVCNIVLGNFNYKKMSLVRDYNHVMDHQLHHNVFEHLFSNEPRKRDTKSYDLDKVDGWHHVVTADPTQTKAILQAQTGESYIIQGPPGTGKSQTITNLIADFVARGKSILFVCEKRAALDVVYHRLKQQGLDELCCYIHDSQGDKREFIKNLKTTYEDFVRQQPGVEALENRRATLLQQVGTHLALLKEYHLSQTARPEQAGLEVRQLIERMIGLKDQLVVLPPAGEEALPHYHEWTRFGELVEQLSQELEASGSEPLFCQHPFSKVREEIFLSETPAGTLQALVAEGQGLLAKVAAAVEGYATGGWEEWPQLNALVEDATLLFPLAETGNLELALPGHPKAQAFERAYRSYKELSHQAREAEEKNSGWKVRFSEQDTLQALPLAREQEKAFFSFFNGSWRRLKKALNEAYDFSRHQVRPAYSTVLEGLKTEYEFRAAVTKARQDLETTYSLPNLEGIFASIEAIRAKKGDREVDFLLQQPEADQLVRSLYRAGALLRQLESCLQKLLYDYDPKTLTEIGDELDNIAANTGQVRDLLPLLRRFAQASAPVKKALRQLSLSAGSLEAAMAHKTLQHIYSEKKFLREADGWTLESSVAHMGKSLDELLQVNAACIRARVRQRFLSHLEISNMALSGLTAEQRLFKKNYSEGRRVLENEFSKSMRYKSIRELAGKESGLVLKDLKPVWLMSPLSVSDSLPVDTTYFDVVIFDEASQITLEEGIPALYRAPQTIIVGDDKQMPPSNFFSARAEDPDDLEALEKDKEEMLSSEADSLLVQGSRKLNSVMLGWHYRSRYETLISYSNHAFYEAALLTIPDRVVHHTEKADISIKAADKAAPHVSALFDRSISFHHLPESVYEKRSNAGEALYIARLVRELLLRKVPESIGIVAFSQEQQRVIEDALDSLAAGDKEFEQLLEEAYGRTENDQYVGLIVKNLENIQGDERDIIILSICYGPDARRKMIMNFGPINKKGGEKRLNVIFSRARKHMAVISTIQHHQVTNEYNEGANYLKRFLHYAEQVSAGNMSMARTILDSLVLQKDSKRTTDASLVRRQLKEALEKEGYEVAEEVGQSGFKCSLAIKARKEDEAYTLGILLDDDRHYANDNLLEQYYQRPALLKAFGWRILQVFVKDWLHQPERVLAEIGKRLKEEPAEVFHPALPVLAGAPLPAELQPLTPLAPGPATGPYDTLEYRRLTFSEGTSHKFWEAAVDGRKLVVRFGRIGAKGQTQVKTFASPEAAEAERDKLVREKQHKGYEEAQG
ncbi:WGR domain-containing protein [Paraflavisolibacter sp. H34]|uniref:WGR domain-containing protein n=1 Tax=Huijunlia imazamoxiresistens TaxID=3127457 RepID=UPI0030181DAC